MSQNVFGFMILVPPSLLTCVFLPTLQEIDKTREFFSNLKDTTYNSKVKAWDEDVICQATAAVMAREVKRRALALMAAYNNFGGFDTAHSTNIKVFPV